MEQNNTASSVEYTVEKLHELRLECSENGEVFLMLKDGTAEIFGAEIHKGNRVRVTGQKLAVYTWTGCQIVVEGSPSVVYIADETPMAAYLNVHTTLNARRQEASASGSSGPRCLIVGPTDSGKSTLTKMLVNWAARSGWEPTMVDLDVGQGSVTAPGCIAAAPIEVPLDIEEGCSSLDMPLVYFYGHASAGDNPELYKFLINRLAGILDRRAAANAKARASGLVINTLGWIDNLGLELQQHAIQAFNADVVIVMEQDRLYSQLSTELRSRGISVVKLAKSGGVVTRERTERRSARESRVKEYFYGVQEAMQPVTQTVRADQLAVFRIGGGTRAPTSALPIGAVSASDPLRLTPVPVNAELVQSLLAVSLATNPEHILSTNVAGFILVKDVDMARGIVTYVSPCPGQLPGRYLVMGSLRSSME